MTEKKISTKKKPDNYYVDKDTLTAQIISWKKRCAEAEEQGKPTPKMPDTIGLAILQMIDKIASRPNFRGYSYIEEMKGAALVTAVKAVYTFKPEIVGREGTVNPFGYFSRTIWHAFLNKMAEEKRKHQGNIDMALDPSQSFFSVNDGDEFGEFESVNDKSELLDYYYGGKI